MSNNDAAAQTTAQRKRKGGFLRSLLACCTSPGGEVAAGAQPTTAATAAKQASTPATTITPQSLAIAQPGGATTTTTQAATVTDPGLLGGGNGRREVPQITGGIGQSDVDPLGLRHASNVTSVAASSDVGGPSGQDFFSPLSVAGSQTPRRSVSNGDSLPPATEAEAVHEALVADEPLTPSSAVIPVTAPVPDAVPALGGSGSTSDISIGVVDADHGTTTADDGGEHWLLPPLTPSMRQRKCLVLDLDETLVHSSFKVIHQADFVVPVEIDQLYHNVYVIKRPGVDEFMRRCGELFEVVVFTASLAKYADPVLDMLDIHKVVRHRLFRESCSYHMANYVKDLGQLGRDLRDTIIIDNSPASYVFHPAHAVPISSWFNDVHDTELIDLMPFLEDLARVDDVSRVLELTME